MVFLSAEFRFSVFLPAACAMSCCDNWPAVFFQRPNRSSTGNGTARDETMQTSPCRQTSYHSSRSTQLARFHILVPALLASSACFGWVYVCIHRSMCTHTLYKYVYLPGPVAHGTPAGPEGPSSRARVPLGPLWSLVSLGARGNSGRARALCGIGVPHYLWDGGSRNS